MVTPFLNFVNDPSNIPLIPRRSTNTRNSSASEPAPSVLSIRHGFDYFFGMLKRERVNRRRYLTVADARADVFDYIKGFHNPRIQRRLDSRTDEISALTHLSAKTG